jgi:hypothetical protein
MARKSRRPDHEMEQGVAPAAGATYSPTDHPDEGMPRGEPPSRSVSHGHPIDQSEYRKLKEQAAKAGRPRAKEAQEDPSAPPCEEDG